MKTRPSTEGQEEADSRASNAETIVICSDRLAALTRLFDPSQVSMSSTNLPGAQKMLDAVLTATSQATHELLGILDCQEDLINQADYYVAQLRVVVADSDNVREEIGDIANRFEEIHRSQRDLMYRVLAGQEHQDLSGQKIKKVLDLLASISTALCGLPGVSPKTEVGASYDAPECGLSLDQESADSILQEAKAAMIKDGA